MEGLLAGPQSAWREGFLGNAQQPASSSISRQKWRWDGGCRLFPSSPSQTSELSAPPSASRCVKTRGRLELLREPGARRVGRRGGWTKIRRRPASLLTLRPDGGGEESRRSFSRGGGCGGGGGGGTRDARAGGDPERRLGAWAKIKRAPSEEECFFDLLSKFQSSRMDDQRCPMEEGRKTTTTEEDEAVAAPAPAPDERGVSQSSSMASPQTEELFDLIASSQSRRLDDQRASVGNLPGLRLTPNNLGHLRMESDSQEPGDDFFNMLMKCQSSRIDDQRCAPPNSVPRGPTVPDEDFFSLIQRVQAKRMDEQRVDLASADEEEEEEEEQQQQVEETSSGSSAKAQL